MKKMFLAIAALMALAMPSLAVAADLPQQPSYKAAPQPMSDVFTGWFIGVEVGADWGSMKPQIAGAPSWSPSGFTGGGSLSYRSAVMQNWYLGLSTSLDWAGGSQTKAITGSVSATGKNDWLGATMVQVGVRVLPDLLVYGEGGVGYGAKKASITFPTGKTTTTLSDTEDGVGFALGVGGEYNLRTLTGYPLLAILEYRHIDLGKTNFGASFGPGITVGTKIKLTDDAMMVGLKYHFGS